MLLTAEATLSGWLTRRSGMLSCSLRSSLAGPPLSNIVAARHFLLAVALGTAEFGGIGEAWILALNRMQIMRTNALLAVCRTAFRRVMAKTDGDVAAAKQAVRVELQRAGFQVAPDDETMTAGMATVIVTLADGRYVQRDASDRWYVKRRPPAGLPEDEEVPIQAGTAADWLR